MEDYVYEALILMKKPLPLCPWKPYIIDDEALNENSHEYILKRQPNIVYFHDTFKEAIILISLMT